MKIRTVLLKALRMSKALVALLRRCRTLLDRSTAGNFGGDVAFLKKHMDVIVLEDSDSPAVIAVIPGMQARVMTSSAEGNNGNSFGWINRELIASGERQKHINVFGGEDRFWLGPEGGQFGIFFEKGAPFDLEHWQTPESIDWGGWDLVTKESNKAHFRKEMSLTNYSGTRFELLANRIIKVLSRAEIEGQLGSSLDRGIKVVGYESDNQVRNQGKAEWNKSTGLLSVWVLGMFKPSQTTTVVIPFLEGPVAGMGEIVNDAYFGKVLADRLKVTRDVIFFKGDGLYRSKIGVPPRRAKNIMGSYDGENRVLTLVKLDLPDNAVDYVNSMWEIQKDPYSGDVVNSYNDGPPGPGKKPLGPFYELESSSPGAALRPGDSIRHVHRTFHLQGSEKELDPIARAALGVALQDIKSAF